MVNEELVIEFMPRARILAKMHHTRSRIEFDECLSIAYAALVECAPRFDRGRGVKFWQFAQKRVQGALSDYSRKLVGRRAFREYVSLKEVSTTYTIDGPVNARITISLGTPFLTRRQREVIEMDIYGLEAAFTQAAEHCHRSQAIARMREVLS